MIILLSICFVNGGLMRVRKMVVLLKKRKNVCVQKKSVWSDKLSCMGWTTTLCSTLFLLLSSPFHFLSFLDIFWVGRVTSVKLGDPHSTNTIPALINMFSHCHICICVDCYIYLLLFFL